MQPRNEPRNNQAKEVADQKLKDAQQRLEQQDNDENRKAVEEAQREVDRIENEGSEQQ